MAQSAHQNFTYKTLSNKAFQRALESKEKIFVQYSGGKYSDHLLKTINRWAEELQNRFYVRFYQSYDDEFDFRILEKLPALRNLWVDYGSDLTSLNSLYHLKHLESLQLSGHVSLPKDFLDSPAFENLRSLRLSTSGAPKLDLRPLENLNKLGKLAISKYGDGLSSISKLQHLEELSLRSISQNQKLDSVSQLKGLKKLSLILGSRSKDLGFNHSKLKSLTLTRVMGLAVFSPEDFPNLRNLRIEDQLKIKEIDFGKVKSKLEWMAIFNCKNLSYIQALAKLANLRKLVLFKTKLDFESTVTDGLPKKLDVLSFGYGKTVDAEIKKRIKEFGYKTISDRFWEH